MRAPVGHEAGGAANAEQAVGHEARAVVAGVVVVRDILVCHDQHALVVQRLQEGASPGMSTCTPQGDSSHPQQKRRRARELDQMA